MELTGRALATLAEEVVTEGWPGTESDFKQKVKRIVSRAEHEHALYMLDVLLKPRDYDQHSTHHSNAAEEALAFITRLFERFDLVDRRDDGVCDYRCYLSNPEENSKMGWAEVQVQDRTSSGRDGRYGDEVVTVRIGRNKHRGGYRELSWVIRTGGTY